MTNEPTPGYRVFKCTQCEYIWHSASYDCTDETYECCPSCENETLPSGYVENKHVTNPSLGG